MPIFFYYSSPKRMKFRSPERPDPIASNNATSGVVSIYFLEECRAAIQGRSSKKFENPAVTLSHSARSEMSILGIRRSDLRALDVSNRHKRWIHTIRKARAI